MEFYQTNTGRERQERDKQRGWRKTEGSYRDLLPVDWEIRGATM